MRIKISEIRWKKDQFEDESGCWHNRAVAEINGKNVCIVQRVGSNFCTAWAGKEAGLVHKDDLEDWLSYHT